MADMAPSCQPNIEHVFSLFIYIRVNRWKQQQEEGDDVFGI